MRLFWLTLIVVGLIFKRGHAWDCDIESKCNCEFGIEWLCMLDSFDQPYYAQNIGSGATFFNGDRVAQEQGWHSGYRLEAAYYFPNGIDHLRARWTHFPNFAERTSEDTFAFNVIGGQSLVTTSDASKMQDCFTFYYLEVLFGRPIYYRCPVTLNLDIGIQYAKIDWRENVFYSDPEFLLAVHGQSKFSGVGPEVVLDFSYALYDYLAITGRMHSALLINRRESQSSASYFSDTPLAYFSKNHRYWLITPEFDFRIGLNYHYPFSFCWCDSLGVDIEVGYEVLDYFKTIDRIFWGYQGISTIEHMDFSMHGPYVRAGICF